MQTAESSRDQWKSAKEQLGRIRPGGPRILIKDGKPVTSPLQMANILNMQYIVSAAKTRKDIPTSNIDPLENYSKLTKDKNLNMAFQPIGSSQNIEAIRKLNPSPSTSTDGI